MSKPAFNLFQRGIWINLEQGLPPGLRAEFSLEYIGGTTPPLATSVIPSPLVRRLFTALGQFAVLRVGTSTSYCQSVKAQ